MIEQKPSIHANKHILVAMPATTKSFRPVAFRLRYLKAPRVAVVERPPNAVADPPVPQA